METSLYVSSQAGLVLLTLVYILLFLREIRNGLASSAISVGVQKKFFNRFAGTLLAWSLLVSAWSISGRMGDFSIFPLNLIPVLAIPIVLLIVLLSSKTFSAALRHIPLANVIRLQSFRIFVEIFLWMLLMANLLPEQMTFEGRNFDILSGLSAAVVAALAARGKISRAGLIAWNAICLGLLLNIVMIAILSTPSPWRVFMNEPANYIVTRFPVSWLPGLLVPLAYYLHAISIKQLMQKKEVVAPGEKESLVGS